MNYNLISGDTVMMGYCVSVSLYLYKKLSNMEEKVTEFNITVPWLERKIVKINKVGKTELILEHFDERCFPSIDNFNCPWRLLSEEDKNVKRYVKGKFTDVCDRLEMNVTPGVEYISDERSNKTLHIDIIGVKVTPDTSNKIYKKYVNELGYKRFNITSINERFPDGHGDFESTDFIYDEHGYYPKDENGNSIIKEWTYRYDSYYYFYKEI